MIAAILGFLSCCVLLSNIFPVFLVMALPCPSSSLPTGSNSSASSSLASANLSDNPPGYDTLMNSQLPSYDDSIVQKTNLPAQVLRNRMDEKLFLTMLQCVGEFVTFCGSKLPLKVVIFYLDD